MISPETPSISERLGQTITQLKYLQTLENKKKNQEQQAKNDHNYQALVHQTVQLCRTVHYAQHIFSFPYQPQTVLLGLIDDLQAAAKKGAVDEDSISQVTRKLKPVQEQLKKEWAKYYPTLVGSVVSTLRIIQKIDPDQVNRCLSAIQNAEVWRSGDSDLPLLQALSEALLNSTVIIERLNLDQEVTAFLTKVSSGTTTLNDLSDSVLTWIRRENLSDKIKLSFR